MKIKKTNKPRIRDLRRDAGRIEVGNVSGEFAGLTLRPRLTNRVLSPDIGVQTPVKQRTSDIKSCSGVMCACKCAENVSQEPPARVSKAQSL